MVLAYGFMMRSSGAINEASALYEQFYPVLSEMLEVTGVRACKKNA